MNPANEREAVTSRRCAYCPCADSLFVAGELQGVDMARVMARPCLLPPGLCVLVPAEDMETSNPADAFVRSAATAPGTDSPGEWRISESTE